jgi:oligopeptide/dipeptide ABC transporter ATP-binding protein
MSQPLLELTGVSKKFPVRDGMRRATVSAVEEVSLRVRSGSTLGVVGESGCGKSTLARLVVGLHEVTRGSVLFDGAVVGSAKGRAKELSREIQMVFQDPASALNPRATVGESIAFPLRVHGAGEEEVTRRVSEVLEEVGLPAAYATHYPHQLSGGQKQRVNIARALALRPRLVVLDEAVSALDKSIQAQILTLLEDLQREHGLTYVFISHDLNVVADELDDVAVMYLGQVVETSESAQLYRTPLHPYTQLLLSSIPALDPDERHGDDVGIAGEIPSPLDPPSGCRFRTRCPLATSLCADVAPTLADAGGGHRVACHLYPGSRPAGVDPDLVPRAAEVRLPAQNTP